MSDQRWSRLGTIRIIDHDVVDRTNLHRQPLYELSDVGSSKAEVAARRLAGISAETKVEILTEALTQANATELIAGSDVVVDATDNFDARYAVSDAARALATPLVTGAVYRWDGQVTTLVAGAVARAVDDTRGGLLLQVAAGRWVEPPAGGLLLPRSGEL